MSFFSTIRGKLYGLIAATLLGFSAFTVLVIFTNNNAVNASQRIMLSGVLRSNINAAAAEIRGYQLLFDQKFLDEFEKRNQKLSSTYAELSEMVNDPALHDELTKLQTQHKEWYNSYPPRIALLKKYGPATFTETFRQSADGQELARLTKTLSAQYLDLQKGTREFSIKLEESDIQRIKRYGHFLETMLILCGIGTTLVIVFLIRSITGSIARLEGSITHITEKKDFTQDITIDGHDELAHMSRKLNDLVVLLRQAFQSIRSSANDNLSVASELSTTTLAIGKRAEEESIIVTQTTTQSDGMRSAMESSVQETQQTKEIALEARTTLQKAQKSLHKTISQLSHTVSVENEINERLNNLSQEAEQVKNVLTVIVLILPIKPTFWH